MTDSGYAHHVFIIDRSGSMHKIYAGMQSGFQEFLAAQQLNPVRATASLWDFDTEIACRYSVQPLEKLTEYQLVPRGSTAMYDAIGQAVTAEGEKLAAMPEAERPALVTVIIVSDGLENSSREYTGEQAAGLLRHQQDAYKWNVLYMGTNQDAFAEGEKISVHHDQSLSYRGTNVGTWKAWQATSSVLSRASVAMAAGGQSVSVAYNEAERKLAGDVSDFVIITGTGTNTDSAGTVK